MGVHIGKQAGLFGSPTQRILSPFTGRRIVQTDEIADNSEMLAGLRRWNGDEWDIELGRDQGCNLAEGDADVINGVEFCPRFSLFQRETKEARRVGHMHRRPSVGAVANIGRNAFLARRCDDFGP